MSCFFSVDIRGILPRPYISKNIDYDFVLNEMNCVGDIPRMSTEKKQDISKRQAQYTPFFDLYSKTYSNVLKNKLEVEKIKVWKRLCQIKSVNFEQKLSCLENKLKSLNEHKMR